MRPALRNVVESAAAAVLLAACATFALWLGTPGLGWLTLGLLFLAMHPFIGRKRR